MSLSEKMVDAAYVGDLVGVERLLSLGADVHVYSDRPLFNACNDRYVGIVVKLVEAGADLEHLKMYWVDLFGCEAPGDLANMSVSEVKELLEVETVRMELI